MQRASEGARQSPCVWPISRRRPAAVAAGVRTCVVAGRWSVLRGPRPIAVAPFSPELLRLFSCSPAAGPAFRPKHCAVRMRYSASGPASTLPCRCRPGVVVCSAFRPSSSSSIRRCTPPNQAALPARAAPPRTQSERVSLLAIHCPLRQASNCRPVRPRCRISPIITRPSPFVRHEARPRVHTRLTTPGPAEARRQSQRPPAHRCCRSGGAVQRPSSNRHSRTGLGEP